MYENNNNALLWIIVVVNVLTLILVTTFFIISWDVISANGETQEVEQEQSAVINEQPTQQQPTQKSALSNEDKECMDECVQGGEIPMKCAEECGIELPQKN